MSETSQTQQFTHRILVEPLGLLSGSKGRFLSPDNLVGRSGYHFPPDTPTLSGIYAAEYGENKDILGKLLLAGPFWAKVENPTQIYVPTPLHCLVENRKINNILYWENGEWHPYPELETSYNYYKLQHNTWISINDWEKIQSLAAFRQVIDAKDEITVKEGPWEGIPHLHPRLQANERRTVGTEDDRGSLFLEYGIQLDPSVCLVYLANHPLPDDGCYRFGGEGHIVQIKSQEIKPTEKINELLEADLNKSFALVCPAVWGSNRLSYQAPFRNKNKDENQLSWGNDNPVKALLTERPDAFRFRLGNQKNDNGDDVHQPHQPKLLSRGRYAVPAGSVYIVEKPLQPWLQWPDGKWPDEGIFPIEGYSFKRWGCGLSFPVDLKLS